MSFLSQFDSLLTQGDIAPAGELVGLNDLWQSTRGDPRVCVAVLDGPVDLGHPSLANANLTLLSPITPGIADDGQASQHGTHVVSIIFGQHDSSVKGIAPNCRGLVIPIFRDSSDGSVTPCSQTDLGRALRLAVDHGAQVINVSAGQFSPYGTAHPLLADAVRYCVRNGALIVAAAGNQGCECLHVPGALPSVLAVGAMNHLGEPMEYSNWGTAYEANGILAPGEGIRGAAAGGGVIENRGTSYATPIVSGVAALLMSLQLKQRKKPDAGGVRSAILQSALGCDHQKVDDCRRLLAGRLNIQGAKSQIQQGVQEMTDSRAVRKDQCVSTSDASTRWNSSEAPPGVQAASCGCGGAKRQDTEELPEEVQDVTENVVQESGARPSVAVASTSGRVASPPGRVASRTRTGATPSSVSSVAPASCGCGGNSGALVYALGSISYDLCTLARQDSIQSEMDDGQSVHNPADMLRFLAAPLNESYASALTWTLNQDASPIYAIQPSGAFALEGFRFLRQVLEEQLNDLSEMASIPGTLHGTIQLYSGQVLPVIKPEVRGLRNWTVGEMLRSLRESPRRMMKEGAEDDIDGLKNYLTRIYYEFRNEGLASQDRALNFSGTNAFVVAGSFQAAATLGLVLDEIEVERSPICRQDSDCWDVKITFFDPEDTNARPRTVFRFTVDVSDVVPVIVGAVRQWQIR